VGACPRTALSTPEPVACGGRGADDEPAGVRRVAAVVAAGRATWLPTMMSSSKSTVFTEAGEWTQGDEVRTWDAGDIGAGTEEPKECG